jgi:hypothetical protein
MNWRRGILLAAINLTVAAPLVVSLELKDATYVRDYYVPPKPGETPPPPPSPATDSKNEGVSFDPCALLVHNPAQEELVNSTNLPALVLTGWRLDCSPSWSLSGMLHVDGLAPPTPSSMAAQRKVDLVLLLVIALQWLLVGGFPLRRPKRLWGEPGIFITICAVISLALFVVPPDNLLSRFFALFATFA